MKQYKIRKFKTMWPKESGHRKRADRAITDHGDLTVKIRNRWAVSFPDENVLPPTARVSAEARDENEWDTHDVWEFRR